jgi:hypothetical protein
LSEFIEADLGVLNMAEVGCGNGTSAFGSVKVMGEPWLENFLFGLCTGVDLDPSGSENESVDELFDSDRELFDP